MDLMLYPSTIFYGISIMFILYCLLLEITLKMLHEYILTAYFTKIAIKVYVNFIQKFTLKIAKNLIFFTKNYNKLKNVKKKRKTLNIEIKKEIAMRSNLNLPKNKICSTTVM